MSDDPFVTIRVTKDESCAFYRRFLTYGNTRVDYDQLVGMSFLLTTTKRSVNFIPTTTSTSFEIVLKTNERTYKVTDYAESFMRFESQERKDTEAIFKNIVRILDEIVKPTVAFNLLTIFSKNGELHLDDCLTISQKGLTKPRFWRGPELLPWDQYYGSILSRGSLNIYKKDEKKEFNFFHSCPLSVMNAVIMPEFLGHLNKRAKADREKDQLVVNNTSRNESSEPVAGNNRFCSSCGSRVVHGQKFCAHCGSKLL